MTVKHFILYHGHETEIPHVKYEKTAFEVDTLSPL